MSPGPLAPVEVTSPRASIGEVCGYQSGQQYPKILEFSLIPPPQLPDYSLICSASQLPSNSKIAQPTIRGAAWPHLFLSLSFYLSYSLALLLSLSSPSLHMAVAGLSLSLPSLFPLPLYNNALKPQTVSDHQGPPCLNDGIGFLLRSLV